MKFAAVVLLTIVGSVPAFAQNQTSCKAYFQVLRARAGSPGLTAGLTAGEKRWWEGEGQKKYPGLCLDGSITSADKPRYLVIWSKSKSIGPASVASDQVFGQPVSALQATAPQEWIYQPRWNVASVTIAYLSWDNRLEAPPVHFASADRTAWVAPGDGKVLKDAVKFLSQEMVFSPTVR